MSETLSFWALVCEDWEAHGRDWTKPGFRAIAGDDQKRSLWISERTRAT